jgi:hypothetical protein
MTDAIDARAEALARARYESGRPMLSGHFDDPPHRPCAAPWPTVPSWSWSSP